MRVRGVAFVVLATVSACVIEYTVPAAGTTDDGGDDTQACAAPQEQCGSICIDVTADPDHCGSCGHVCGPGEVCDLGECAASCSDGREACARACVDLQTDMRHCGACGEACDVDGACVAGDCKDGCGDTCHDEREICVARTCECRSGFERCGTTCVSFDNDPDHCGECDNDCGSDPCGGGQCRPEGCGAFVAQCGGSCSDLDDDPLHCGRCEDPCDGDEICEDGECEDDHSGSDS